MDTFALACFACCTLLYLLYWHKVYKILTLKALLGVLWINLLAWALRVGTQFTCFTGTKILTLEALLGVLWINLLAWALRELVEMSKRSGGGTQFTCLTGTKVQILALRELVEMSKRSGRGTQFTCCTGTEVHILTQVLAQLSRRSCWSYIHTHCASRRKVLSLPAFMVQKYKY